jgi:hypothetical protein
VVDPRVDWDLLKTDDLKCSFVQKQASAADVLLGGTEKTTYYRRLDVKYFERKGVRLRTLVLV